MTNSGGLVSISVVKKLREQTGAGVMACRQVLEKTQGDFDQALEELTKGHQEIAAKKADRETSQGKVFAYVHGDGKIGALVALSCETDFVARTGDFADLGKELAMQVVAMNPANSKELLTQNYIRDPEILVEDLLSKMIAKTGENIRVKDIYRLEI
ncbi:MAG: translation elongation factor Ts [Candidatus Shapirobacteria bacterium]|nr:translation elongation factor Ts [Candidatus Shapirobacteria bacterium]MDD5073810.1 translation elongation factor Ts [Candidatus Shapirobacteria bacterium]MDD5481505.1 translation elongation factor Ts [Candidatus Shapirobacteria bacterium]